MFLEVILELMEILMFQESFGLLGLEDIQFKLLEMVEEAEDL